MRQTNDQQTATAALRTQAGRVLLVITPAGHKKRRHRSTIPMAMVENIITRLQQIVLSGTDANVLRLVTVAYGVFRPGPHEKKRVSRR